MEDKFLIRVDEEMPSDERTAIKIIETGVGHEIKERIEVLLERIDAIAATNNIDILREMKEILSGLLDSISALSKRNSFVSEMMLKMDKKIQNQEKTDLSYIEGKVTSLDEALGQMTSGVAKLLADIQVSIENLNNGLFSNTQTTSRIEEKINEKFVEMSVSNEELNDKNSEVLEKLQVIDSISADLDVRIQEIRHAVEENATRLGETINAAHVTSHDLIEKINEKLDATYMNDAELTQKINEIYVNTNSLLANMESKLVQINSEINSRIQELSISNAELIERSRSLSFDITTVSDKLNEKMGEISVINAEIAEKMRELLENNGSANIENKLAELHADINEMSSGAAELIKGVEENVRDIGEKNAQIFSEFQRLASNSSEMINRLEERMASAATSNMEVLGRLEEKITEVQIDNKQQWSKIENIISGNIATPEALEVVGQRIINLRDVMRGDISVLAEEIKKLQKKPRTRRKTEKRARSRARPKKARRTRATKQIEDEALDILIVNTLKNVSMTIDSLSRATKVSETRLRKRLTVLMTRGVIAQEKKGRSVFYVSRVEEKG